MSKVFLKRGQVPDYKNKNYPQELLDSYQCNDYTQTLFENLGKEKQNIRFGELTLNPHTHYPPHRHKVREIYYIESGEAEWAVDGEKTIVTAGDCVYHKPWAVHEMTNQSDLPLKALWIRWINDLDEDIDEYAELINNPKHTQAI